MAPHLVNKIRSTVQSRLEHNKCTPSVPQKKHKDNGFGLIKAKGYISSKRGNRNHSQNSTHDTSSKEEDAKTGAGASNQGDISHLATGMAAGLGQFLP